MPSKVFVSGHPSGDIFEVFYDFPKGTTINILHQALSVVGFELMMNVFGTGTEHSRHICIEALSSSPPGCGVVAAWRACPYFETKIWGGPMINFDKNPTNGKFREFSYKILNKEKKCRERKELRMLWRRE